MSSRPAASNLISEYLTNSMFARYPEIFYILGKCFPNI
nr:MAG TPA: hypothetical protein [Caudoviricetes sp.]